MSTKRNVPNRNKKKSQYRGKQGRKDSSDKRVNFDNERESKFQEYVAKTEGSNDISWYTRNPELFKSAASVGYSSVTGQELPFLMPQTAIPGVLAIHWIPSLGIGKSDAINIAAKNMYSFVVHANSRNKSYDANDLMIMVLAGSEVFSMLSAMIRAYGIANTYSGTNSYTPDSLLQAMGFIPSDFRANLAQIWFDINNLISQTTQIWIPKNIQLITRRFWMNSNVYMDAESPKAQYYLYSQKRFMQYKETFYTTGGALIPAVDPANKSIAFDTLNLHTWEEWREVCQNMISSLTDSQDRGIIFGDVLRAFGKENIYGISEIPSSFRIEPVYNMEVLMEIENTTIQSAAIPAGVYQNMQNNTLENIFESTNSSIPNNTLGTAPKQTVLNFHTKESPTAEMIMVASRMQTIGAKLTQKANTIIPSDYNKSNVTLGHNWVWVPESAGTEMAVAATYFGKWATNDTPFGIEASNFGYMYGNFGGGPDWPGTAFSPQSMFLWSAFDWAPWKYWLRNPTGATYSEGSTISDTALAIGDWDQSLLMEANEIDKLHIAALYSMMGIPMM